MSCGASSGPTITSHDHTEGSTTTDTAKVTRINQVGAVFVPVTDQDRALEFR